MIDERRLKELASMRKGGPVYVEIFDTLESLWKIARAARRWMRASPGPDSVKAESELDKALDAIQGTLQ